MSQLVLPTLPGIGRKITREPYTRVVVQEAVSGKEYRSSWWSSARVRYRLSYDFLRSAAALKEFQQLVSFFARHFGQLDSFLFSDPEDCSVSDHGFGAGDGSATTFQLQRSLLGDVYDVLGGPWAVSSKPRTNLLRYSQEFDNAAWTKGLEALITPNVAVAPDGTATADRFATAPTAASDAYVFQSAAARSGETYTLSWFIQRGNWDWYRFMIYDGTAGNSARVWVDLSTGKVGSTYVNGSGVLAGATVTAMAGGWHRVTLTASVGASSYTAQVNAKAGDGSDTTQPSTQCHLWGAQLEEGSTPTRYIPTTTAAVTSTPAYWPAYSGGFEPVWAPIWSTVQITQEGDWAGKRMLYPWARTNLLPYSEQFDHTTWLKEYAGTGILPVVTANAGAAPDGTATAERVQLSLGGGTTAGDYSRLTSALVPHTTGKTYTWSTWLKTSDGSTKTVRLDVSGAAAIAVTVTGSWQRFSTTWTASTSNSYRSRIGLMGGLTSDAADLLVWGAQYEEGSAATGYIPTTTAATSRTDYTMGTNGALTLAVAPPSGACLAWSGSYYRRVRFADDGLSLERKVAQMWRAGSVELVSVKP